MGRPTGSGPDLRKLLSLPVLLPLLFFGGLIALEIGQGLHRLRTLRSRQRSELCEGLERQHARLAREVQALLGEGRQHADYLARTPAVGELLDAAGPEARPAAERLERLLLPYLVSFRGVDRVRLLDPEGRERVRCERIGAGVGAIPAGRLDPLPDAAVLELARGAPPGEVVVSRLFVDAQRVEVRESERQVFHYVVPLERDGRPAGLLALTVYAAPIQHALEAFRPLPGTSSALLDPAGEPFGVASPVGAGAGPGVEELLARDPGARAALLGGAARLETEDGLLLAQPLGTALPAVLVTAVPEAALSAATEATQAEHLRIIASMVAVTALTALASVFFLRTSQRAARLREAEEYLVRIRRESEKYQALMEAAADLILILDPEDGRLLECNARAREALGLAPEGAGDEGTPLSRCAAEEDRAAFREGLSRAAGGHSVAMPDLVLRDVRGERLEVDARFVAIEFGGQRVVQVSLRDLTRERDMERQVQTAERLSSLGLLTAGVAHEINNPLAGILNYLTLLERGKPERATHYLAQVRLGFERIRDIVGELLRFARPAPGRGTADLARVVERAVAMARYAEPMRTVTVETQGLDVPLEVPGDPGRLEQVLLNLLLNAGRAMAGGGIVRVRAAGAGDWVELRVEDEGHGIAPEDLGRIFDPFFSRSGGSGLGLAVSYGIIRAHGGSLAARNLPGGGAQFTVRLPRTSPAASVARRAPGPEEGAKT